ncbi:Phosphopantetheine attachment site [Sinosporangium album]|uniref:Phosphopantetheine attachment site n=1 Tax=Sinosporangium album TaxID=504805 RepID=A0A1G7SHH6_9ACTN|nr:acyl carrier protein [Sinosporangium album]SDG22438.1 Phosphopantetheine attachment site [Sinosporangium album]
MDRKRILATIVETACAIDDKLDGSAITLDGAPLKDHGVTSLTVLQVAARLEDDYGITINDTEVMLADSALALVELVERKTAAAA